MAVLAMMLALGLVETVGVMSVMPFLAVLGNPEMVETHPALAWAYEHGGFESVDGFLFALGLGAFILVALSACFRILTTYAINRWAEMRRYSIGARLLARYLRQPYAFFLGRNSADLSKSILSEVDDLVLQVFRPGLNALAYGLVVVVLVVLLLVVDPVLAVVVASVIGGTYATAYLAVRTLLGRIGADRLEANRERFTAASEAFGGIKDIKVLDREAVYLDRFRGPAYRFARQKSLSATLSTVPKYVIEAVGVGGVLFLSLAMLSGRGDLGAVLPILGLYTFAGYRLLPAAQQVYSGVSRLRFGMPAVDAMYEELVLRTADSQPWAPTRETLAMRLRQELALDNVSFRYPGTDGLALKDVSLRVPAGSSVGIVGTTGAGKTTMVDLLLGLLFPTDGSIAVDGRLLTPETVRAWRRSVGYVPQTIYLSDASVAENIAFGLDPDEIDYDAVASAASIAAIDRFVREELPEGYATVVGEKGVRLSGGQRQRIGIARALYHNPEVLVFDEATSALDTNTERSIVEAIGKLRGAKTIIIVAHRLSTVRDCDHIVRIEHGKIVEMGSPEGVLEPGINAAEPLA